MELVNIFRDKGNVGIILSRKYLGVYFGKRYLGKLPVYFYFKQKNRFQKCYNLKNKVKGRI
ncbi:hypothetical protein GCM10009865_22360 [Aeromicrobium ponti]